LFPFLIIFIYPENHPVNLAKLLDA